MKKILGIFFLLSFFYANSQDAFIKETDKIWKRIHRGVELEVRDDFPRLFEFHLLNINIDSQGRIDGFVLLSSDSSVQAPAIKQAMPSVITAWQPVTSSYTNIYIPIFIINPGSDQEETTEDRQLSQAFTSFETLRNYKSKRGIYFTRPVFLKADF